MVLHIDTYILTSDTSVCSVSLLNWPGHHEVYYGRKNYPDLLSFITFIRKSG